MQATSPRFPNASSYTVQGFNEELARCGVKASTEVGNGGVDDADTLVARMSARTVAKSPAGVQWRRLIAPDVMAQQIARSLAADRALGERVVRDLVRTPTDPGAGRGLLAGHWTLATALTNLVGQLHARTGLPLDGCLDLCVQARKTAGQQGDPRQPGNFESWLAGQADTLEAQARAMAGDQVADQAAAAGQPGPARAGSGLAPTAAGHVRPGEPIPAQRDMKHARPPLAGGTSPWTRPVPVDAPARKPRGDLPAWVDRTAQAVVQGSLQASSIGSTNPRWFSFLLAELAAVASDWPPFGTPEGPGPCAARDPAWRRLAVFIAEVCGQGQATLPDLMKLPLAVKASLLQAAASCLGVEVLDGMQPESRQAALQVFLRLAQTFTPRELLGPDDRAWISRARQALPSGPVVAVERRPDKPLEGGRMADWTVAWKEVLRRLELPPREIGEVDQATFGGEKTALGRLEGGVTWAHLRPRACGWLATLRTQQLAEHGRSGARFDDPVHASVARALAAVEAAAPGLDKLEVPASPPPGADASDDWRWDAVDRVYWRALGNELGWYTPVGAGRGGADGRGALPGAAAPFAKAHAAKPTQPD